MEGGEGGELDAGGGESMNSKRLREGRVLKFFSQVNSYICNLLFFTPFSFSDITECCKGLGREWISIVGVTDTQRYHGDASWGQYVAAVMSSLVDKVLQDDQVFAILGGEGKEPRRHSPLAGRSLQETVSLKGRIN